MKFKNSVSPPCLLPTLQRVWGQVVHLPQHYPRLHPVERENYRRQTFNGMESRILLREVDYLTPNPQPFVMYGFTKFQHKSNLLFIGNSHSNSSTCIVRSGKCGWALLIQHYMGLGNNQGCPTLIFIWVYLLYLYSFQKIEKKIFTQPILQSKFQNY